MLTHELVHVGAPFAPARRPWFMEGMATYLEPLIRGLGGAIPHRAVWDEWLRAMPTGAAALNTEGLDGRGHPYWSGALFFLLAQYETAKLGRSDGLAPCFRAFRRQLGDASQRTSVRNLMHICDQAPGVNPSCRTFTGATRPLLISTSGRSGKRWGYSEVKMVLY